MKLSLLRAGYKGKNPDWYVRDEEKRPPAEDGTRIVGHTIPEMQCMGYLVAGPFETREEADAKRQSMEEAHG